ncbi:ORF6C domain-containing protein [Paenibacillus glucanolyticus]|uniref:ORF6C domain-containing protein n=1 Tax=Paenibacillus glucanolyticus TaxID=59843 RepID=UPI001CE19034|nr:ORF6C domain-containing protein [Mycolicibacterium fortuitum]
MHDPQLLLTLKRENEELKNSARKPRREQRMLQKRAKERIVLLLGGKDSAEYSMHSKDYFHEMWNAFYARFGVTSFWDTLLFDYDDALVWIGEWLPAVKEVQVVPCLLCEEKPGTLDTGEGVICEACAQIMGELA